MIALRFTAWTNTRPPIRVTRVRFNPYRRHPAIAPRSRRAPNATNTTSNAKYCDQPRTRASPNPAFAVGDPGARPANCSLMLMSVRTRRGLTGPMKCTCVGKDCPNRTTSPGPSVLRVGGAVPTATVCPSTETDRSGVNRSANAIDAAATTTSVPTTTSARGSGERRCAHRRVRSDRLCSQAWSRGGPAAGEMKCVAARHHLTHASAPRLRAASVPSEPVPARPYAAGTFFWGSMKGSAAVMPVRAPSSASISRRVPGVASPMGTQT